MLTVFKIHFRWKYIKYIELEPKLIMLKRLRGVLFVFKYSALLLLSALCLNSRISVSRCLCLQVQFLD